MSIILMCAICSAVLAQTSDYRQQDLLIRLRLFDAAAFRMTVEDMNTPAEKWKDALTELVSNHHTLVAGIKNNDKKAIEKAQSLLAKLDRVLLGNPLLRNREIMVIERQFATNARKRMNGEAGLVQHNFQNNSAFTRPKNGWNNSLVVLSGFGSDIKRKKLFHPGDSSIISDVEKHFSGDRLMYSSIGTGDRWQLFELDINTGKSRQITPEAYASDFDSFDGCYTVDGRYIFCSTATFMGLPCTNGQDKMCGLFIYDPATDQIRQLTFDQDSNWNPVMMNNGQILYQRWEYADLPHTYSRMLFTMNPDGTGQLAYYGSGSYFPTSFFGARPIPGSSNNAIVGIATGHHGTSRSGRLLIVDPSKNRHDPDNVTAEIPYRGKKVEQTVRDRLVDGVWPQFLQPYPLNEKYFLVTMKASPESLWGVYLVDVFNNITPVIQEEDAGYFEATLMGESEKPALISDRIKPDSKTATVFLQDVYFGGGLKGIPRGAVKKLRIGSYSFSPWYQGGTPGLHGLDGPCDVKRILGEVDVEADGSAMFTVPSNTPLFLQPLDSTGKALQIMRSWFTAMPGESVSCLGCHEERNVAPNLKKTLASNAAPQQIKEFCGPRRGVGFRQEVQPVLDRACVACHNGSQPELPYLKGDSMMPKWRSDIHYSAPEDEGGAFTESYYQLQRHVRHPGLESDMRMLAPTDVHADQTELFQMLNSGHHGVQLTDEETRRLALWIDMNAPFHGRRSDINKYERTKQSRELKAKYAPVFGVELDDIEWMPEIPEVKPEYPPAKPLVPLGDTAKIKGWPHNAQPGNERFEDWTQIHLGEFQKSIDLGNGVKLEMIKVPAGKYIMGSARNDNEKPMSVQTVEKPFWIGRLEITNRQYSLFDASHDSRMEHYHGWNHARTGYPLNEPDQPAVRVSWSDAMEYCRWLSDRTGLNFTLPTEAEWEWACRAGTATAYSFGDIGADYMLHANMGDRRMSEFAECTTHKWYESIRLLNSPNRYDDWIPHDDRVYDGELVSSTAGRYRPNPWDIYDMHGNVWEWTRSAYVPYPFNNDERNDPSAGFGTQRTVRGGSWYDRPHKCTSSYRLGYCDYL
ncbi:MAG: SUMF1/EgtB/PvdO family nonheme iron enzyme, partial [Tannerella sp.]|nr:SUMF1/EgtB/PvdO family nonheme iron enzyme [Tannerella sp.]